MADETDQVPPREWWRDAVVYQVYIRSFADGDGDGIGDVAGIRSRLGYLSTLGVDAIWITPWYPSPFADGGYDVADYCGIAPVFGDLDQAAELITEAHRHGLRIILDLVPNHTSAEHPWFRRAVSAAPGSAERAWYWFRPGDGSGGDDPPNDWPSVFGGPAWQRLSAADGEGVPEWYLHLFAPEQPDLNWTNPAVADAFDAVLRFWFDRGVDGFRIDVANAMAKDPALPDLGAGRARGQESEPPAREEGTVDHPYWDRDEIHPIFRRWRRIADSYASSDEGPRMFVAEAWRVRPGGLARYLRPDELHSAFNFEYLTAPWDAGALRGIIERHIETLDAVGASPTWVLSNHDTVRVVTRYAPRDEHGSPDLEVGRRRARAAALLMLALPGGAYVYQGDELGLDEVEDLPDGVLQDPIWRRSGHRVRGRDGCRVPLPWNGAPPSLGFGSHAPWLPQPAAWTNLVAARQTDDPASMLRLYRQAIALRRLRLVGDGGPLVWHDAGNGALSFSRGGAYGCLVNVTGDDVRLDPGATVLLASGPLEGHRLPTDTTAWVVASGG